MEFGEKLQELRKRRGLTQEELAQALYVSRTAVSKWESGRGYPSIDSLKELAAFFSVSVDELLSGEKLVSLAQKEKRADIRRLCRVLFAVTDLLAVTLVVLPLYPRPMGDFVAAVSLLGYGQARAAHWVLLGALVLAGAVKLVLCLTRTEKGQSVVTGISLALGAAAVLFPAMTRAPYAVAMAFLLLAVKAALVYEMAKTGR